MTTKSLSKKCLIPLLAAMLISNIVIAAETDKVTAKNPSAVKHPGVQIINPKMPKPNALDYFIKAGNLIKNKDAIVEAMNQESCSIEEKVKLVRLNSTTLAMTRKGFNYKFMERPLRSIDDGLPHILNYNKLSYLLIFDGQIRESEQDWKGAMDCYLDALQFGEMIARGGGEMGLLISKAIQSKTIPSAFSATKHLDAEQAKTALRRMEKINSLHTPLSDRWQEQKWQTLAAIKGIFDGKIDPKGEDETTKEWQKLPAYVKKQTLKEYAQYLDIYSEQAQQPYALRPKDPYNPPSNPEFSRIPIETIVAIFMPLRDDIWCAASTHEAKSALLTIKIALQAYKSEHNAYPKSLDELVPTYLKKLPGDPFALKGPLQYRLDGDSYILYSLGPDCKDDQGKPIDQQPRTISDFVDAKGDLICPH